MDESRTTLMRFVLIRTRSVPSQRTFIEGKSRLVEFDQHATELDIMTTSLNPEQSVTICVNAGRSTPAEPPSTVNGAGAGIDVVVLVRRAEHPPVGVLCSIRCPRQAVPAVPAVSGHRQPILVCFVADGEG